MKRHITVSCLSVVLALQLIALQIEALASENNPKLAPVINVRPNNTEKVTVKPSATTPAPALKAPDCPVNCTCLISEQKVLCEGKRLKVIPNLSKLTNITMVSLANNSIEDLDLNKLPLSSLENLDLSLNLVKNIILLPPKTNPPAKLKRLSLQSNKLESLEEFAKIKLTALESLDLSMNPLKAIDGSAFNNTKSLRSLKIQEQSTLKRLNESSFAPLTELTYLNMSHMQLANLELGSKLFSFNQKLKTLDLTNNSLIEVPHFLRSAPSIAHLILDKNLMTSLRQSDFIDQQDLSDLVIRQCPRLISVDPLTFSNLNHLRSITLADNPKLQFISSEAFKSDDQFNITLTSLNLSGNNLSSLHDLGQFHSLILAEVDLSNNPWDCNCGQRWLAAPHNKGLIIKSPIHCNTPPEYKDIEVSQFFANVDCEAHESSRQTLIVALFLVFLLVLTIAVIIQKNNLCHRFLWRDQYGTIYYTKASFPPETA